MKHGYRVLIILTALLLAATGVGMSILPDIVPAHYNFAGEVDRMGGRRERDGAPQEKILLGAAFFEVVLFSGLGLYFMWQAARYAPGDTGPAVTVDFFRVAGMGVGLLLILLGNVMPKASGSALLGFSAVGLGFALIMFGIFLDSLPYFILCLAAGPVWAGLCIAMSHRFYKEAG